MNPWQLATHELIVGAVAVHFVCDWPLQSSWMAEHKADPQHAAGYLHALVHGVGLGFLLGWVALAVAGVHWLIDIKRPRRFWARLVRGDIPRLDERRRIHPLLPTSRQLLLRSMADQGLHIAVICGAALVVGS